MEQNPELTTATPKKRPRLLWAPVLIGFALIIGACSSDIASDAPTATATPTPVGTPVPADEPAPATETPAAPAENVPPATETPVPVAHVSRSIEATPEPAESDTCVDGLPDADKECGRLTVPVNHDEPDGDTFSLPYVVLPALGENPSAEPVVFLQGGPGFSTMSAIGLFAHDPDFREDRDIIFLEQRGTDPTGVFLDCGPFEDLQTCHDRYVSEGIDLSAFTTLNAAKDLAALRSELGIERWHLLGASYGTTLAMVAMDNDPEGTASVVLDAPTAPDVVIYNADTESLLDAFTSVFADCAADADCSDRNPDLFNTHLANFDQLMDEPWNVANTEIAQEVGPAFDHLSYLDWSLGVVIASPGGLPAFVTAVAERDADALLALLEGFEDDDPDSTEELEAADAPFALGLRHSIYCAEEAPFFDLETNPIDTAADWPTEIVDVFLNVYVLDCEPWDVEPADPGDVDQIVSAIPTLILAGEYDFTTPIRQAEIAAAGLSEAEVIEVPSTGHTTLDNDCARRIMVDFLRAPGGDRSCLADVEPILWK